MNKRISSISFHDRLNHVTQFSFGPRDDQVHIVLVNDDKEQWAIRRNGFVFNRNGKWEYEPMPSARTDEFIERTRFDLESAWKQVEGMKW